MIVAVIMGRCAVLTTSTTRTPRPRPAVYRVRLSLPRRCGPAAADPADGQRAVGVAGGRLELGETIAQAAVREVREETGVEVEVTGLAGI